MKYIETDNINVEELISSWRMTDSEMDNYIMASRSAHHLFMPTRESLNNIMNEDSAKLMKLLSLNNHYFEIIDKDRVIGVATILDNKELTYVVPFKYQRRVLIITLIQEIMNKYGINKIVRIEDLGKIETNKLPKVETDNYNSELNIIKKTIDILLNNGYSKEDILNDITEYMDTKTYQKK